MTVSLALDGQVMIPDGSHFSLIDVDPSQITAKDIALTLSKMCRFGARIQKFYSVGEHCTWCAYQAYMDGVSPEGCFAVLMHDAQEAYTQDIVSPLKRMIADEYKPIEARVSAAVGERFGIDFDKWDDVIKEIDHAMVLAERAALYPGYTGVWPNEEGTRRLDIKFAFEEPAAAENSFMRYFYQFSRKSDAN
jgi:hypothetical protein